MTPLEFFEKWGNGCGHQMCARANHVVLARGSAPCDVVFVGEAPGISEDCIGLPFVGPAGHKMDYVLEAAFNMAGTAPRYALCNLVGCIPRDDDGKKTTDLSESQVTSCTPRLLEFLELCKPRLIVTLGDLVSGWLDQKRRHGIRLPDSLSKVRMIETVHPAAIIRAPLAQQSLMQQRMAVVIATAIRSLYQT